MKKYDVAGLGNALLDITINVDDNTLKVLGFKKASMTLIDDKRYADVLKKICELKSKSSSGGSASNTIKGVSILGGKSAFMGMVGADNYGDRYLESVAKSNVLPKISKSKKGTGVSIIFITPDYERTMATYLGAALEFTEKNIDEALIKDSKILHIEGFFLEPKNHKKAALKAMKIAKKYNTKISVDLSDPDLIIRNLSSFRKILREYVDIVFVNEHEAKAFTGKENEHAAHHLSKYCDISIVKLGPKGSILKHGKDIHKIPIHKVKVINTNGAGDAYAAGILYGLTHDIPLEQAGRIAALISGKVVASEGATLEYFLDSKNLIKALKS